MTTFPPSPIVSYEGLLSTFGAMADAQLDRRPWSEIADVFALASAALVQTRHRDFAFGRGLFFAPSDLMMRLPFPLVGNGTIESELAAEMSAFTSAWASS